MNATATGNEGCEWIHEVVMDQLLSLGLSPVTCHIQSLERCDVLASE
jgi:hypothetical protein